MLSQGLALDLKLSLKQSHRRSDGGNHRIILLFVSLKSTGLVKKKKKSILGRLGMEIMIEKMRKDSRL